MQKRMKFSIFQMRIIVGFLVLTSATLAAENFPPPAEGPIAFRRDRIPLDTNAMADLSVNLLVLAQSSKHESATHRRMVAQMLALATALDPGNAKARQAISQLRKKQSFPASQPNASSSDASQNHLWSILDWLQTPEAGRDGLALANCLSDVVIQFNPEHPKAKPQSPNERGAWHQWVPPIAAYETLKKPNPPAPVETAAAPSFKLKEAMTSTVVWQRATSNEIESTSSIPKWNLTFTKILMSAGPLDDKAELNRPDELSIQILPSTPQPGYQMLTDSLLKLLKAQASLSPLPAGRITLRIPAWEKAGPTSQPLTISAATAVLCSAAITGQEPDATILGTVDETGSFNLPAHFWNQLQALPSSGGGRLILPGAAIEYLPAFLALEKPQFFMNYEVLFASDFKELLKLSAKKTDPSAELAFANFQEIRKKIGTQSLSTYVANPYVRKRLVEVFRMLPNHQSAKLLAIQGAGNRPTLLPRSVLVPELRRAIEPMDWLVGRNRMILEPEDQFRIAPTSERCRSAVEQLSRYVAKEDRALFTEVQDMLSTLRTLDRVSRARDELYEVQLATTSAYATTIKAYKAVIQTLTAIDSAH
jgi:hypothetical protein